MKCGGNTQAGAMRSRLPVAGRRSHTSPAMPASGDSTDEALMLAYAGGEAAAFDVLYDRHKGGVYRYLLRQCGQARIADEMFQDLWMNLIRARTSYVVSAKFTTWLYRLAHNRLIDHYRASGVAMLVSADDEAHVEQVNAIVGDPSAV